MMAVPQSGPIMRRPFSIAFFFSSISSSMVMLSEKSMTLSPRLMALRTSSLAMGPGREIMQKLASSRRSAASSMVAGLSSSALEPPALVLR